MLVSSSYIDFQNKNGMTSEGVPNDSFSPPKIAIGGVGAR